MKYLIKISSLIIIGIILHSPAWTAELSQNEFQPKIEIWSGSLVSASAATVSGVDIFGLNFLGIGLGAGSITGVIAPSFGYFLDPHFEVVVSVNINHNIRKTSPMINMTSLYRFTGGLVFNLSEKVENSFFLRGEAGASILEFNNSSSNYFTASAQLGKRFKVTQNISYTPAVIFETISTLPAQTLSLTAVPLQLSLLF